ncbi:Transcriptional regulator [Olavius sp. associated proteobacterium Delta 1]|nr:Transcriptional regulator [Olavius sp. associated proteobacterium Delta 1]
MQSLYKSNSVKPEYGLWDTQSIQFLVLSIREAKFMGKNKLKEIRESMLMSKSELARQANVSPITITRIEKNMPCRMETQRKILFALGLKPADKHKIFKD